MKMKQPGILGAPSAAYRFSNSLGDSPTSCRNRLLNAPRLEKPTAWHTSVTVRLVARSRSWARSTRRWDRCAAGERPYVAVKSRWKWYLLIPATAASPARSSGSLKCRSAWSRARRRWTSTSPGARSVVTGVP